MNGFRTEVNQRFDAMNDSINQRFDAVNQRFDAVNERFDAINERFDELNGRIISSIKWSVGTIATFGLIITMK